VVERNRRHLEADVRPAPAHRVADPVAFTFDVLRDSFSGAERALTADRESAGAQDLADTPFDGRYDNPYYSKLYARQGPTLRARLAASATDIGSLWLSAWDEAGRPAVDASFRVPYVRRQSRAILVSLDGSAADLLDDAVTRGIMPSLSRLRQRGATATSSLSTLPAKPAPGHAAPFPRRPLHRCVDRPQRHRRQRRGRAGRVGPEKRRRLHVDTPRRRAPMGDRRPPGPRRQRRVRHADVSLQPVPRRAPLRRQLRPWADAHERLPGRSVPRPCLHRGRSVPA